jgi:crotonobetainyl-CoA:carnitine CoA-transferase CaiB-like acyl-CoA transferase
MAERAARREEVLAIVTKALATDTAANWEARLRPLGVPAACVRTLPQALAEAPGALMTAGHYHLVASPVRIAGYFPGYGPPPQLGDHSQGPHS